MQILDSILFMLAEMAPYILLGFLIAGIMHAFVPQRIMARHLASPGAGAVVKAALLGIPLPLCSCGVLPTAVALRRGGASRAATTSFLVATPQTGVDSIAATYSMLGPAFAIIRPIAALVTALGAGLTVGSSEKKEKTGSCNAVIEEGVPETGSFGKRCLDALKYGFVDLVSSIGGWLVSGLVIAALITVYVPSDFFAALGDRPLIAMIAVVIVAIPMYVCATGSIPIAMSLMLKGLSPGTALVLLMAGPAANFASFTLISREMGKKAAALYILSIVVGAIGFGLIIDYLLPAKWFVLPHVGSHGSCHAAVMGWFPMFCAGVIGGLLVFAFGRRFFRKTKKFNNMTQVYIVSGMNCSHCQASVTKAISNVEGVTQVDVDLSSGKATVEGEHDPEAVKAAVRAAGFDVK